MGERSAGEGLVDRHEPCGRIVPSMALMRLSSSSSRPPVKARRYYRSNRHKRGLIDVTWARSRAKSQEDPALLPFQRRRLWLLLLDRRPAARPLPALLFDPLHA